MDWDKAKKIVIIILILLNGALLGLNYNKDRKYVLSSSQERAIFQVLSNNGIGIYTNIVQKFPPMRQLSVKTPTLETDALKKMFFPKDENISISVEFDKTILKSGAITVTLLNNAISLSCPGGLGALGEFTKQNAQQAADSYLDSLGAAYEKFTLDSTTAGEDNFLFEYYEVFQKYKIFSNRCRILVTEKGITEVTVTYYNIESFTGQKIEICSPDEALLTFMRAMREEGQMQGSFIRSMELGYDIQEKTEIADGSTLKLVPCYHIYVSGRQQPYVINAYNNKLIE